MPDPILAAISALGVLVWATGSVAVYRVGSRRGDADVYGRLGVALACAVLYVAGILTCASLVQLDGPRGDGALMLVPTLAGLVWLATPFGNAVGYETWDGRLGQALVWPLALPLMALLKFAVWGVCFLARGPETWGTTLANLVDGRRSRDHSIAEREARIAAKEHELGLEAKCLTP